MDKRFQQNIPARQPILKRINKLGKQRIVAIGLLESKSFQVMLQSASALATQDIDVVNYLA